MEILKRKLKISRETFVDKEVQFSINNWGHFVIRVFDKENENEDLLIVFAGDTTKRLLMFCKNLPYI